MSSARLLSVVDDDDSVRTAMGRFIQSLDFAVELFGSAEAFLESSGLQEISCLILDVRLPGMSGLQLQDHLAEHGFRIPIIFITACPDERARTRALNAGAVDFLPKPFTDEALLSGIRSALKLCHEEGYRAKSVV
ncbi:MAG: two-component system response regulator [Acidobacteria bacterium]|nr:MAG: two-component system response regulator [Acidobacteriota bacterium]